VTQVTYQMVVLIMCHRLQRRPHGAFL